MRKLILQEWLSMDGYAADKNGRTSFLESITLNKYSDLDQLKWMDTIDLIILGANTCRMFAEFWPTVTIDQEVIADKLNSTSKLVFSKTLQNAPWGKWPAATVISTDAIAAIRKLKAAEGGDIVLWGSIFLVRSLMKANLIDEYHFRIVPTVLDGGTPMFEHTGPMDFELYDSKLYEPGLMALLYRRK